MMDWCLVPRSAVDYCSNVVRNPLQTLSLDSSDPAEKLDTGWFEGGG